MNMKKETADVEPKHEPEVLFEDSDVLVINKPHGLLTHGDGRNTDSTVVDWFLERTPKASGVGEEASDQQGNSIDRSGVVHRLDRETSGVLILAKNQTAFEHLKKQFHDREVKKEYNALVYGKLNDRWGTINRAIGRSGKDSRRRSAERGARGVLRTAITDFERISMGEYEGESFSSVKLFPKTGRTHQLRAHLRAIERPIVGDTLYAEYKFEPNKDGSARSNHLSCKRLMLHASSLQLTLLDGTLKQFFAPLPQLFEEATNRLNV